MPIDCPLPLATRTRAAIFAFTMLWSTAFAAAPTNTASQAGGTVAAIGGALQSDNTAVWSRLVEAAGGKGSRWVVLPTASGAPEQSGRAIVETLQRYGAVAEVIPLSARIAGRDVTKDVRDAGLIARIAQSRGVFFTGGAQGRITDALFVDGKPTPMLEAINDVLRRGGVIAGSSAGAAVMPRVMIRDIPDQLKVMREGLTMGRDIDRGLAFVGNELFVDQHCVKRGRIGRMLLTMALQRYAIGVCVEENTAAFIRDGVMEAVGASHLVVVDLRDASVERAPPLQIKGGLLHAIERGDQYNLRTHQVIVPASKAGRKIDPSAGDFAPYYGAVPFYADMLGDRTIVNAMSTLLDSREREAKGLAFRPANAKDAAGDEARTGFEFRLSKRADTYGYAPKSGEGTDYGVFNISLDVLPVKMASPLYVPVPAAAAALSSDAAKVTKAGENDGVRHRTPLESAK
jgi:cyanophycinase